MGEMADMYLENAVEGAWLDEWHGMEHWYDARPRKDLQCSFCGKKNLNWHNVKGHWVMFEPSGSRLHTCTKYSPPLEVLKELAKTSINLSRMKELDKLYNRMMTGGGVKKIIKSVTHQQLIDLFIRLNREHTIDEGEDDGWKWSNKTNYAKQLAQLREEIVRRMSK